MSIVDLAREMYSDQDTSGVVAAFKLRAPSTDTTSTLSVDVNVIDIQQLSNLPLKYVAQGLVFSVPVKYDSSGGGNEYSGLLYRMVVSLILEYYAESKSKVLWNRIDLDCCTHTVSKYAPKTNRGHGNASLHSAFQLAVRKEVGEMVCALRPHDLGVMEDFIDTPPTKEQAARRLRLFDHQLTSTAELLNFTILRDLCKDHPKSHMSIMITVPECLNLPLLHDIVSSSSGVKHCFHIPSDESAP